MDVAFLAEKLNLTIQCGTENLNREVSGGYVGDLLSNVMASSTNGDAWITCQTHQNIVAVSVLKEHACIILIQGRQPEEDTVERASREGIPILVTELSGFEIVGRIYKLMHP
ncbi:MAG TPA: DRTGG domain-containing protein [Syntrophales bacterium]|nr:DRTGG domain-containing protein [Syntrophales bacterium]HPQ44012.1 DRTGG domain-containing protein [Syntrophales bacterium]